MTAQEQNKLIQDLYQYLNHKQIYLTNDIYKADCGNFLSYAGKVVNLSNLLIEIGFDNVLRVSMLLDDEIVKFSYDTDNMSSVEILIDIKSDFIPIKLMAKAYFINNMNGLNIQTEEQLDAAVVGRVNKFLSPERSKQLMDILEKKTKGLNIQTEEDLKNEIAYRVQLRSREHRMNEMCKSSLIGLNIQTEQEFEQMLDKQLKSNSESGSSRLVGVFTNKGERLNIQTDKQFNREVERRLKAFAETEGDIFEGIFDDEVKKQTIFDKLKAFFSSK